MPKCVLRKDVGKQQVFQWRGHRFLVVLQAFPNYTTAPCGAGCRTGSAGDLEQLRFTNQTKSEHVMEDEPIALVERWRDGDEEAATTLYQLYVDRLMQIVSNHLLSSYQKQVEPEDVLQSAFGTVFRRLRNGRFEFDSDADVWKLLVTVVLNKLRNRVRYLNAERRDIRREMKGEADFDGALAAQLAIPPGVEEATEFAYLMRDLFELPSLSEDEKKLLQLRMEGFGQQEIADQLGVTDRTIRRMTDRIRDRLNDLLGSEEG